MDLNKLYEKNLDELMAEAREVRERHFGNKVYVRALIELTNYCKNDCYYCGIRAGNSNILRYRMSEEDVLRSCASGYERGYRTFVMQGGEDPYFDKVRMERIIKKIRGKYADCAITLSLGEHDKNTYQAWFDAGANRYLLRHETATTEHYGKLHPKELLLENRLECLSNLKEIGYQTGTGFMIGSPGQTREHLIKDLEFVRSFQPHMVGVGPFIPHKDTIYKDHPHGSSELTLRMISIIRLILPEALLPSTTALATIDPKGREKGILAGANVLMPNVSPKEARDNYSLYDNKSRTDENLRDKMKSIGYEIVESRGDYKCTM